MKKVLVIGESIIKNKEYYKALKKEGYQAEFRTFYDYEDNNSKYALIISEIPSKYERVAFFQNLIRIYDGKILAVVNDETDKDLFECRQEGISDFIFLPIREKELIMKVRSLLMENEQPVEKLSGVLFSDMDYKISFYDKWVSLTKNEYKICKALAKRSNVIFSKDHIYEFIYDLEADTQIRTITEYIYSIRKKCKDLKINPIATIWGRGYRWNFSESGGI